MDIVRKEIIQGFKKIKYKTGFILKAADHFGKVPATLRVHWFSASGFYSIPKKYREELLEMVKAETKKEELTKAS